MKRIGILGAGAWGTALAKALSREGREIILWGRDPELVKAINYTHENVIYLSKVGLPTSIHATTDLNDLLDVEALLLVAPAQKTREILEKFATQLPSWIPLIICSKGIENESGQLLSDVVQETVDGNPIAILSGPNFAHEIVLGLPAATTIATKDRDLGFLLVESFGSPTFRPYYSSDPVGVQIGGALKNVYAIASGVTSGKNLGQNASAALITRCLAEMARLGQRLGADYQTFSGLSGVGDLMLSCSSERSRNMRFGIELGQGKTPHEIMSVTRSIFEGYHTAFSIKKLAKNADVDMPVAEGVYRILYEDANIDTTIKNLLSRPFSEETRF
ncbi:MAG: NAD(P)H-dependent glycerol-3-phosphate dehydrogenase [Alphaproteobacteria bacterium]|nr:NAD(P)H-dependent glycerol-3-phosphate dehydrogenase [Alphaproteobacteria bacterium]